MKVKCRIALAIDASGNWSANGWGISGKQTTDKKMMDCAIESCEDGERKYWLEVEVDAPESLTEHHVIGATVLPA